LAAQASYDRHKTYLDNHWRSPYDYIVVSKFGERFGFEKVLLDQKIGDDSKESDSLYKAHPSLTHASKYTIENGMTYLRLVLNDFPYDVDDSIEHWCLWKIGGSRSSTLEEEGITKDELIWALKELASLAADGDSGSGCILKEGAEELALSFRDSFDSAENPSVCNRDMKALCWVNPPHLQSMPEIYHAHILVSENEVNPSPPPV